MDDGGIILTSDLGPSICDPDDEEGPSDDLDVVEVDANGENRKDLTDPGNRNGPDERDEVELIGDEVSWFCGAKPNLSPCTRFPKIWNICSFKFWFDIVNDTTGHQWNDSAYRGLHGKRHLYERALKTYASFMQSSDPVTYDAMLQQMNLYGDYYCVYDWTKVPSWWVIPSRFGVYDTTLPLPPRLTSPRRDSLVDIGQTVVFDWSDALDTGATYSLQITRDPSFRMIDITEEDLANSTATESGLAQDTVYYWRSAAHNQSGVTWSNVWRFSTHATSGAEELRDRTSDVTPVYRNYPNPFERTTTIRFQLGRASHVTLAVYDIFGRQIDVVVDQFLSAGLHSAIWDAAGQIPGVYSYRIIVTQPTVVGTSDHVSSRTMMLVR